MTIEQLPTPLNAQERLLYAIAVRQDILIEQNNSIINHLSKRDEVAVTNHVSKEVTQEALVQVEPDVEQSPVATVSVPKKRAPRKPKVKE